MHKQAIGLLAVLSSAMLTGCLQTGMQAVQGLTDRAAESYGQTQTLQNVRESLAEVEAQKTGRVLLPRGAQAIPAVYVDDFGAVLTNGVTLSEWYVVNRRIANRLVSPPAGTLPATALPSPVPSTAPAGGSLLDGPINSTVTP